MNKKGFTLVELLAVLIILAVLAVIITPIVSESVEKATNKTKLRSVENYIKAIDIAMTESELNGVIVNDDIYNIMQDGNLCIGNFIDGECDNPLKINAKGEKPISGEIIIKDAEIVNYLFKYNDDTMISNGNLETEICTLIEGSKNEIGSKYECEVKDNVKYNFFVLSHNEDGTTNLIMDKNIYYDEVEDVGYEADETNIGGVYWSDGWQNSEGPVAAMDYLYNATKDWYYIPALNLNYQDEGHVNYGYTGITTTGKITNIINKNSDISRSYNYLRARLPEADELSVQGCIIGSNGSCPLWLSNYLSSSTYQTATNIPNIEGYWTLSSTKTKNGYSNYAFRLRYKEATGSVSISASGIGVRPVITLSLD